MTGSYLYWLNVHNEMQRFHLCMWSVCVHIDYSSPGFMSPAMIHPCTRGQAVVLIDLQFMSCLHADLMLCSYGHLVISIDWLGWVDMKWRRYWLWLVVLHAVGHVHVGQQWLLLIWQFFWCACCCQLLLTCLSDWLVIQYIVHVFACVYHCRLMSVWVAHLL